MGTAIIFAENDQKVYKLCKIWKQNYATPCRGFKGPQFGLYNKYLTATKAIRA